MIAQQTVSITLFCSVLDIKGIGTKVKSKVELSAIIII